MTYGHYCGNDFINLGDQKKSYKIVSNLARLRRSGRLKLRIGGKDYGK